MPGSRSCPSSPKIRAVLALALENLSFCPLRPFTAYC